MSPKFLQMYLAKLSRSPRKRTRHLQIARVLRVPRSRMLLVSASSVDPPRMVFPPRPRSWLPTFLTTSRRIGYVQSSCPKCHHVLTPIQLLEIFKDYQPSSAKIALRPIPRFMVKKLQARGEARKGRGFGFVTLGSEELQQKACAEMNGKEIEGREIAVKVAIDSPGKEDDHLEGAAPEGEENTPVEAPKEAAAAATEAAA